SGSREARMAHVRSAQESMAQASSAHEDLQGLAHESLAHESLAQAGLSDESLCVERCAQSGELPNLRHLRVFQAVARLGSITGASREARLSQPAVTQGIAKLEALLDVALFERHQSGCYL